MQGIFFLEKTDVPLIRKAPAAAPKKMTKSSPEAKNKEAQAKLEEFLQAMALDEERILANLAFEPILSGRQLKERHFTAQDFQGLDSSRALLASMLDVLQADETLNLPNLMKRLSEEKQGNRSKLDLAGGAERVEKLMLTPFSKPGVTILEDLDPVIERIRDRNLRARARRSMVQYAERIGRDQEDAFETLGACIQELRALFLQGSTGYLRGIDVHLNQLEDYIQENRTKRSGYSGYEARFPLLQEKLNGIQKEFYLFTGGVGMGKSTLVTQFAWDLVEFNPDLTVIYFSLDLSRMDVLAKIVGQVAEVPIDFVKNPYVTGSDFDERRRIGLEKVSAMRDRLFIIDESNGRLFIEDIRKVVKRTRLERGGEVAVIIDPVAKIHLRNQNLSFTEKCNLLAAELKSISASEGVTLIATAGLPRAISNRRPTREDLEEIMGLLYDPYVVCFLYCDYLNDFETPFLEWELGKENFMIPISEITIAKNKMGSINNRIFYRYYEAYSKFKECAPAEVENYNAMVENLQKFKDDKTLKNRSRQQGHGHSDKSGSVNTMREDEF